MGVFLDKPKKEKESESGEGNGLRYALCSMQGWRVEMEDAHAIKLELGPTLKNCSYFAVFDGHAGDFVSKYSSEHLIDTIMELWFTSDACTNNISSADSKFTSDSNDVLQQSHLTDSAEVDKFREKVKEGFLKIDSKMRELPKFLSGEERSGTTAVAAFVTPNKIIFANCGDSRAILCRSKEVVFATHDHKPYNEEEKKRIENAGGTVMIQRVNGTLAVSRALGDYDYKNVTGLPATEQLVSAEPDLTILERAEEDEYLILACDGVWDVMSNEEVVTYIHSRLAVQENLQKVCEELLETCLAKGSRDNMSVILIVFPKAPTVDNDAIEKEKILDAELRKRVEEIVKKKDGTSVSAVIDALQHIDIPHLPPGGGLHSKLYLIEEIMDQLIPNRNKEEGRSGMLGSLPMPLSMIRQLALDQSEVEVMDQDES